MIRSLETLPADLRTARLESMRDQAAQRLARVTRMKAASKGTKGQRVTFPHGGRAE